jgi:hypothetical protein
VQATVALLNSLKLLADTQCSVTVTYVSILPRRLFQVIDSKTALHSRFQSRFHMWLQLDTAKQCLIICQKGGFGHSYAA